MARGMVAARLTPSPERLFRAHDGRQVFRRPGGAEEWALGGGRTLVMGVLNVTPDSFFGDSRIAGGEAARRAAFQMVADGADLLDIGGESTRPGAEEVGVEEELERVLPVIEAVRRSVEVPISIDTRKAAVARACIDAGAWLVNDVSGGLTDAEMPAVVSEFSVPVILGHILGTPATMQNSPSYADVLGEVCQALEERVEVFVAAGVARENILIDPGIGFGKRVEDNVALLGGLSAVAALGQPLVIGLSRKRFLGTLLSDAGLSDAGPESRLEASVAAAVLAADRGASVVRTHDVAATRRALAVVDGLGPGMAG